MNDFEIEPIRRYDKFKQLVAAGMQWKEVRHWVIYLLAVPILVTGGAFILSFFLMLASGFPFKVALFCAASLLGFCTVIWAMRKFGMRPRSLIFHRDGTIETPFGIPTSSSIRQFVFSQAEITTFEKQLAGKFTNTGGPDYSYYFVDLMTKKGEWVTVAATLSEQASYRLTVQLTKALREIREAAAIPAVREFTAQDALHMARETMRYARPGDTVNVMID